MKYLVNYILLKDVYSSCYWSLCCLFCPYLVRLTVGDLSLAAGPVEALPAYPEESRSPWTWDCRLLGTHTLSRSCSSLSSALSAVKSSVSTSAHALKTQSNAVQVTTQNWKSRSLIHTPRKWRRAPEGKKKLTGSFPSLLLYTNLLKESICRPLVRILPFYHQKVTETCKLLCIAKTGQLTFQTWQLPCFKSDLSPSFLPPTLEEEEKKKKKACKGVTSRPKENF